MTQVWTKLKYEGFVYACQIWCNGCISANKFLKISKDIIAQSLCDIFNASIESKTFLDDFKISIVTPIFKEGEKDA